jgi:hypothetical protein
MSPRSPLLDQRVALFVLALMLPKIERLIVRVTATRGDHQGGGMGRPRPVWPLEWVGSVRPRARIGPSAVPSFFSFFLNLYSFKYSRKSF